MKEIELIDKRKANEKHFLQEDGTIVAKVYSSNVHYLKDGKYEEIDNTLIQENDYYVNKNNDYKVLFKEKGKDSLMRMERKDSYLDIKLKQSNPSKLKKQKKISQYVEEVSYDNILDGIDVEYQTLPTKVKETIVLKDNKTKVLKFEVDTNLSLELIDGTIVAKDKNEKIFTIESPYMEDSNGVINQNISYEINNSDGIYEIELQLDSNWLDSEERVYPVYIDPTISDNKSITGVMDTYIYPGDTDAIRYNQPILKAGVERIDGKDIINRTLIKFDLPKIGTGSEVINATLSLCGYLTYNWTGTNYNNPIEIHRIIKPWTEEEANWENMNNEYDDKVDSMGLGNRSRIENDVIIAEYSSFPYGDITDLVKHWYKDTPNYGILIKAVKEEYVDENYPAFYSKNHTFQNGNPEPVLSISYRNQSGLESYYDYQSQQFTDGITSVNTYNGNLVGVFGLGSTIGSKLPATLSLVYNTNDVILKDNGFQFSLTQTLKEVNIEGEKYYEYVDGDGTTHYFHNQKYRVLKSNMKEPSIEDILDENYNEDDWYETREYCGDEDGLMLKLEQEEDKLVIIDKYDSRMIFSKNNEIDELYYLKELKDTSNNKIQITHNQNNQIVKVVDSSNDEISIDYSTSNMIKIVSPAMESTVGFTNHKVNYITTMNGTTTFEYNDKNIISSIIDVNGTKMIYEYYEEIPYRIKKVIQYGLNNSLGKSLLFQYGFNETSIIDNKNRTNTILFNSSGNKISSNTIGVEDDIDNAYSTVNSVSENTSDHYYEKNKFLSSNPMVKYVKNYLKNTSFETDLDMFTITSSLTKSFTEDIYVTGKRSLKLESNSSNQCAIYQVNLEKGNYYTFSGYFKCDDDIILSLSYYNQENELVEETENIDITTKFKRSNVTIYYAEDASSPLNINIKIPNQNTIYVDDIQLEDGEVVNYYNMIENSDFSEGLSDWVLEPIDPTKTDTYQVMQFHNNKSTALKINLSNSNSISKVIPVSGKAGDKYDISLWFKNEGIFSDGSTVENYVDIEYEPVDEDIIQYAIARPQLIPNKRWQFMNYKDEAPYDYKSITIKMKHRYQFNQMCITNIFLYKDLNTTYYNYDTYGNLISTNDTEDAHSTFEYDKNNQLISATNPVGKNYTFEYDNIQKERLVNAISSNGISNKIKYDDRDNPVSTRISKTGNSKPFNGFSGLFSGLYTIRSKGTNRYLKLMDGKLSLMSDPCSNTIFDVSCTDGSYKNFKIKLSTNSEYGLKYYEGRLVLGNIQSDDISYGESDSIFLLTEKDNGSFTIEVKLNESEYGIVKVENDHLIFTKEKEFDNPACQFYFELANEKFIETDATYSENGKFITSVTDSLLNKQLYDINPINGLTNSTTNANDITTTYQYNDKKQITSITQGNRNVYYTYNNQNLLSTITQGNREYKFTYDDFLNPKTVSIGDEIILVSNSYEENNGNLLKTTYGNHHEISFDYDEFDRVKTLHNMDHTYHYKYNSNGNIAKMISDSSIQKYEYDNSERIIKQKNGDFTIEYDYNRNNSITDRIYKLDGQQSVIHYTLDQDDNLLTSYIDDKMDYSYTDDIRFDYTYDGLGRLIQKSINRNFNTKYDYLTLGNRTSNILKSMENGNDKYSYKYDKMYNITHLYYNDELQKKYYYDDYNELIKEEDYQNNVKIEYNYDNLGNLLTKSKTNLETNVIIKTDTYQYSNSDWIDQLTNFNGSSITYDEIGNPITIGNSIILNWINGRSLSSYSDSSKGLNISYQYNVNGIRTSKVVNAVETKYYLENSNIIYEKRGTDTLYYLYDKNGILGLKYNNDVYYYIKNLQEDIIGILDSSYNRIVSYEYDSWGKILSVKDQEGNEITNPNHIGIMNPFRYRSYYYDEETKLYYLNSRYYNPEWGRFLNADGIIGANKDILGYNLYAYVSNNPVNNYDPSGNGIFSAIIVGAIVAKVVVTVVSNVYLAKTNRDISRDMFNKSMYTPKGNISKKTQQKIENKTKNTSELKQAIKSCIDGSNGNSFSTNECSGSLQYTTGDLYTSIQKANYSISGFRESNNRWEINVNLNDVYNFDNLRTITRSEIEITEGNLANDLGFVMQRVGALASYRWDVNYSMTFIDE